MRTAPERNANPNLALYLTQTKPKIISVTIMDSRKANIHIVTD
jgi:hypothetical protein